VTLSKTGQLAIAAHKVPMKYGQVLRIAIDQALIPMIDPASAHLGELLKGAVNCKKVGAYVFEKVGLGSASTFEAACITGLAAGANALYSALNNVDGAALEFGLAGTARGVDKNKDGKMDEIVTGAWSGDLSYAGRLRGYHDISESTNVDVGGSVMLGHTAPTDVETDFDPSRTTTLYGIDATVRWRPLQRSIYRSFIGRSEVVWSRRERSAGRIDSTGFYVSGDYQLARRWFAGARLDRSDRLDEDVLRDKSYSALITFWPSEFSQLRGQYRHTNYADGPAANEFLFQLQFSIGAHGAHPF
jgi:hypothetical protein